MHPHVWEKNIQCGGYKYTPRVTGTFRTPQTSCSSGIPHFPCIGNSTHPVCGHPQLFPVLRYKSCMHSASVPICSGVRLCCFALSSQVSSLSFVFMASSRNAVSVYTSVASDRSVCREEVSPNKESVFVSSITLSNEVSTGGVFGWMAALVFFSVNFLLCGFLKSFSTIFADVIDTVPPHLSWFLGQIGHLSLVCSPVTSELISRYGYRPSVISAAALSSAGLILSYFENSGEPLIGILTTILGVGVSFAFTQFVFCFGHPGDRPVARTISLSGGFLTAIVKPSVINALLEVLGANYTFLVFFAAISLCGLLSVPSRLNLSPVAKGCCSEVRKSDQSNLAAAASFVLKRVLLLRFLGDPTFFLTMSSIFVMGMGYQHFLHHTPQQVKAFEVAPDAATMLLSYAAVGDLVARVGYGVVSRRLSSTRSAEYALAFTISAAAFVLTTLFSSYGYFVVSAVLAGLGTGLWIVLLPLLLEANHGVENFDSIYTLVRHFQMVVNISYSPMVPMLQYKFGDGVVVLIVRGLVCFFALLGCLFHIVVRVRGRKMCPEDVK